MQHALLLTLLFATSVAAAPADKTLARRVRDEDAQDRTLKMAVLSGAVASKLLSLKEHGHNIDDLSPELVADLAEVHPMKSSLA